MYSKLIIKNFFILLLCVVLGGCSVTPYYSGNETADANQNNYVLVTGRFEFSPKLKNMKKEKITFSIIDQTKVGFQNDLLSLNQVNSKGVFRLAIAPGQYSMSDISINRGHYVKSVYVNEKFSAISELKFKAKAGEITNLGVIHLNLVNDTVLFESKNNQQEVAYFLENKSLSNYADQPIVFYSSNEKDLSQ